jgi:[NiFe] hydrogenase diaphorase moiety large subunit
MSAEICHRTGLLDALWQCQREYGFVRDEDVRDLAESLGISQIEVQGVLSFYHFFHRKWPGQYTVYLNNSMVARCKGFGRVRQAFERETGERFGGSGPCGIFGLFETACIGLSDQEPAALINFYPFTSLNSLKVREIVARLLCGEAVEAICDEIPHNVRGTLDPDKAILIRDYRAGEAISRLAQYEPASVIEAISRSQLAGMGGAFFPTGKKWQFCQQEPASPKYVVCNADEGEPGTFKDRFLLDAMPGLMLEGMIIAGYAVGANQGIIYLRAEYFWLKPRLDQTIEQFRVNGWLGQNIAGIKGFDFDVRIQMGAGAYVCGEETALLNSLEGKRGEPRPKYFYPTQKGFLGQPTVVNNVETFCAAARVLELGPEFFLQTGTTQSPGTKLLSVSGDCRRPGIYEIEWGTPVRHILQQCEAHDPRVIQISGPSGQCLSMGEVDRAIARDDLPCGGSLMIFDGSRDLLDILRNFADFFKHEACGVCTPCRAGNFIVQRKLEKIGAGLARPTDFEDLRKWGGIMKAASRCGLGVSATNSLVAALERFPGYFASRMAADEDRIRSSFRLEQAVEDYEEFRG